MAGLNRCYLFGLIHLIPADYRSTDGMCTWRCRAVVLFQALIVPVGRIFNVVGSIIDAYMELSFSSQFNTTIPIRDQYFVESHENLTYTLTYPTLKGYYLDEIINIALRDLACHLDYLKQG